MLDGTTLTAYGGAGNGGLLNNNLDLTFGINNQQQQAAAGGDVFPYSVDVTGLTGYNKYAASRNDILTGNRANVNAAANGNQANNPYSAAGYNQIQRGGGGSGLATSLTGGRGGYNNNGGMSTLTGGRYNNQLQNAVSNQQHTGLTSTMASYNQLMNAQNNPTTISPLSGYNHLSTTMQPQLYNQGSNSYNYGAAVVGVGTGSTTAQPTMYSQRSNNFNYGAVRANIGTGSGVASTTNANPYVYKLIKRQLQDLPLDLAAEDTNQISQLLERFHSIQELHVSQRERCSRCTYCARRYAYG